MIYWGKMEKRKRSRGRQREREGGEGALKRKSAAF